MLLCNQRTRFYGVCFKALLHNFCTIISLRSLVSTFDQLQTLEKPIATLENLLVSSYRSILPIQSQSKCGKHGTPIRHSSLEGPTKISLFFTPKSSNFSGGSRSRVIRMYGIRDLVFPNPNGRLQAVGATSPITSGSRITAHKRRLRASSIDFAGLWNNSQKTTTSSTNCFIFFSFWLRQLN